MEMSTLGVAFLTLVGGYALAKGEVSEKLALRHGAGIAPAACTRSHGAAVASPWPRRSALGLFAQGGDPSGRVKGAGAVADLGGGGNR